MSEKGTVDVRARLEFTGFDWVATDGDVMAFGGTRDEAMSEFLRSAGDGVRVVFVEPQSRRRSASRALEDATDVALLGGGPVPRSARKLTVRP